MTNRIGFVILAVAGTAGVRVLSQDAPVVPADSPPAGELLCRLDRTVASPGQVVRLTGLIRADHDATVREVWHDAVRVAEYDPKAGRLKNLKAGLFYPVGPPGPEVFENLPMNSTTPGADGVMLWDVQTPRVKGLEFEFKPKQLGTFLIYAKWEFTTTRQQVEAPPVLLVVRPPMDAKGRPVARPEGLDKDAP